MLPNHITIVQCWFHAGTEGTGEPVAGQESTARKTGKKYRNQKKADERPPQYLTANPSLADLMIN